MTSPAALSILVKAWPKPLSMLATETRWSCGKLDRLGRSQKHLIEIVNGLAARQVGFQNLRESMDTTTSGGKLIFHVFGALAEFERELIRERTHAGLLAARARGRNGGRPAKMDPRKTSMARVLMENPNANIADVCDTSRYPEQRCIGTLKRLLVIDL